MPFFKKLFRQKEPSDSKLTIDNKMLDEIILEAIQEKSISTYLSNSHGEPTNKYEAAAIKLFQLLDASLEISPNNSAALYAKSEAFRLLGDDQNAELILNKLISQDPDYLDAQLRRNYYELSNNLFSHEIWNENQKSIHWKILAREQEAPVQIVREGLSLTVVILIDNKNALSNPRVYWRPIWQDTPFGPIFAHYVVTRNDGNYKFKEYLIPTVKSAEHPEDGINLIQRLCKLSSIYIVSHEKNEIVFNCKYNYPNETKTYLRKILEKISTTKIGPNLTDSYVNAKEWYFQNTNPSDIINSTYQ